jgi:hypothetical protein
MSLAILFHFLCAQHVSDINISIIGSLWLFCWITALVVLLLVRCVLDPHLVPKVLEKGTAIPLLTLRAFIAYKKGENLHTCNRCNI